MSVRWNPERPFREEFGRILLEQVDAAIKTVHGGAEDPEDAVHDLRKRCKEIRAMLRLGYAELDRETYRSENGFFRDLARRYSERRDRWVYAETVDLVPVPFGWSAEEWAEAGKYWKRALRAHHADLTPGGRPSGFATAERELRAARARIDRWLPDVEETEFPSGGLRRTYRRGRKEFHAARENPTPHNLHLWRKRAKYLWHHFTTLEGIFPEIIEPLGTLQHHLSSLLGEDHDLFILDEFLSAHPAISPDEGSLAPIHEAIARRREELQGEAFALGRKLYLESPAGFVGRMRGYRVEAAT